MQALEADLEQLHQQTTTTALWQSDKARLQSSMAQQQELLQAKQTEIQQLQRDLTSCRNHMAYLEDTLSSE